MREVGWREVRRLGREERSLEDHYHQSRTACVEILHSLKLGMDRIAVLLDIRPFSKLDTGFPAGYPMGAGYRISGRVPNI